MAERGADYFPLFIDLDGKRVVVIGGGAVAERKVRSVLECGASSSPKATEDSALRSSEGAKEGAKLTVVAPRLTTGLRELVSGGRISHEDRPYKSGDLDGAALAFVAVDDPEVSAAAAKEAEAAGVLVNVVDRPEECRFIVPSVLRRGRLAIAISTGGASPAWAKRIRERLEGEFGEEYARLLEAAAGVRRRYCKEIPDPARRREALGRLADDSLLDLARSSGVEELMREMEGRAGLGSETS